MTSKQLFLLGTGRSGTTLLQRFLNVHEDIMIWGEHSGFLNQLAESYFVLKDCSSMKEYSYQHVAPSDCKDLRIFYKNPKKWQAWMNWFRPEDLASFYRQQLELIFNPEQVCKTKVWGFKEIRYGQNDLVIRFLRDLYPDAIFLSVVRDALNVIESQLTTFHQGASRFTRIKRLMQLPILWRIAKLWRDMNNTFVYWTSQDANFYFIKYEEFIKDYTIIQEIFDKLGLEIINSQIDVLNLNEGRGSGFKKSSNQNDRWKKLGFIPAFIAECIVGKASENFGYKRPSILKVATFFSRIFN